MPSLRSDAPDEKLSFCPLSSHTTGGKAALQTNKYYNMGILLGTQFTQPTCQKKSVYADFIVPNSNKYYVK